MSIHASKLTGGVPNASVNSWIKNRSAMKRLCQLCFCLILVMIFCLQQSWAETGKSLAKGLWGGPNLRMEVNDSGADLEFACGSGTISGPIELNQNGEFRASGTFKQDSFGPTREGAVTDREASFTGSLEGDTLKIEMVLSGEDRVQKFTVNRGRGTKLVKCK